MTEHTGTRWVILETPKKNILAKISSLKSYGKLKMEELKIEYKRKNSGVWFFQILGEPKSKTYSFHDGEVLRKLKDGYIPLRKYGVGMYVFILGVFCVFTFVCFFLKNKTEIVQKNISYKPALVAEESQGVKNKSDGERNNKNHKIILEQPEKNQDPKSHERFLEAKRQFQYGQLMGSFKILKEEMKTFSKEDQKESASMLSELYYLQCLNWLKQHEERKAVINCEKAIGLFPHEKAKAFLKQQEENAKKFYLEGYVTHRFNPNEAKQKYRLVLQSARTKSSWRNKAQYQLRKLKK